MANKLGSDSTGTKPMNANNKGQKKTPLVINKKM
jgi:hypothetical protein